MRSALPTLLLGLLACSPGCVSCRGAEARASPQQSPGWAPAGDREPVPAPPTPRPPADQVPYEAPPTASPGPPPERTPDEPAAPTPTSAPTATPGRAKLTTTRESEGGMVIEQHANGTIIIGSPNTAAPTSPASLLAQPMQAPAMQGLPFAPLVAPAALPPRGPGLFRIAARRVGGGLFYLATGLAPGQAPALTVAAAPPQFALQPVTTYQAVPVQQVQYLQYAQAAPQLVVQAPPQPLAFPAPPPPSPCRWLFGR